MRFSKARRAFLDPVSEPAASPQFEPVPQDPPNYLDMPLDTVLPGATQAAAKAGSLVFHSVGDTGGINGTQTQEAVAAAMEAQMAATNEGVRPAFLFHLGDVIYYNGVSTDYVPQFYEPYQYYAGPIFAIPGNHDGDRRVRKGDDPDGEPSLYGFFKNFCSQTPDYYFKHRQTMTQPYCYWTLIAPFVRIIGLYSNIDGILDSQQQLWLRDEMKSCPSDKWLIVAVHHPCFSLDTTHGGYQDILDSLDQAAAAAGRSPDAVLSGHVHNYQRFSRKVANRVATPYIVAGAGGYANAVKSMHKLQKGLADKKLPVKTTRPDVTLESFNAEDSGYLRVTVGADALTFDYFAVPFDGDPPADPFDSVTVKRKGQTA
jgi:predicted phosphodiesterase